MRIAVGGAASVQGAVCLMMQTADANALMWLAGMLAVVSGAALVVGFLTPASGALAALATLFLVATSSPPGTSLRIDVLTAVILLVDAAALSLLGPGALSMDARLFGRREIIIPHDPLA